MDAEKKLILDDEWGASNPADPKPSDAKTVEVDDDWKAQARREQEELAKKLDEQEAKARDAANAPKADILSIIETFAYQAMMFLGMVEHPSAPGKAIFDPIQSKYLIDCLVVLRDKTEGNLSADETKILTETIHGLQMSWVEMSQAYARARADQAAKGVGQVQGAGQVKASGGIGGASGLIVD